MFGTTAPYLLFWFCDDKKAVCGECQENMACSGDQTNFFTTPNLRKTLIVWHPDKFKELKETEKATKKASKDSSQN